MFVKKRQFIDGTTTMKKETIVSHEKSDAHDYAESIHFNTKVKPTSAPGLKSCQQLEEKEAKKMELLFRNAHGVVKQRKSFKDYEWLCRLDEMKGLKPGGTYRHANNAKIFAGFIADAEKNSLREKIMKARFFSITSDGSTDCAITEQEIVFIRLAVEGELLVWLN